MLVWAAAAAAAAATTLAPLSVGFGLTQASHQQIPRLPVLDHHGLVFENAQTLTITTSTRLTKTMFVSSNQVNSGTVDVVVAPDSVHQWAGAWNPSPVRHLPVC